MTTSLLCAIVFSYGIPTGTARADDSDAEIAALRREMSDMRDACEHRLATLEERLLQLEAVSTARPTAETAPPAIDELAQLRAAAREAAGTPKPSARGRPSAPSTDLEPTIGHERNLNQLNPEISVTGDIVATSDGSNHDFDPREFELDVQSALDPFSAAHSWRGRLAVAWITSVAASAAGLGASYRWDFPAGPAVVCMLGLFLVVHAARRLRPDRR